MGETKMLPIEEAKAVRHATTLRIPTGASREFGEDAIKSAIEHQAATANATRVSSILKGLAVFWRSLIGSVAVQDPKESAR
jgi:hypothetical protein